MAVRVVDSITKLDASYAGAVLIAASHGGLYPAYLAALAHLRGVVLHDAGLGLDRAGIASLDYLDRLGMAAATVSHLSARIGDGADMATRGVLSFANRAASALGCAPGQVCRDAAEAMLAASPCEAEPPPYEEARFLLRRQAGEPDVWGLDSNSLVRPEDEGAIIVTGSHGAARRQARDRDPRRGARRPLSRCRYRHRPRRYLAPAGARGARHHRRHGGRRQRPHRRRPLRLADRPPLRAHSRRRARRRTHRDAGP